MNKDILEKAIDILLAFNSASSLRDISEDEFQHVQEAIGTILLDYERVIEIGEALLKEDKKSSKIIDLMAEEISNLYKNNEPCDLSFKVDCKKNEDCKECIKQYFEKILNEEN